MWLREIEKALKRFGASLEWLMERVQIREEEIEEVRKGEIEETEKEQTLRVKRMKSIEDVLEEVGVLVDTHFFMEFSETK